MLRHERFVLQQICACAIIKKNIWQEVAMRIDGAGGCFDNRLYEVDIDVAWNIALLCVNEMGVTIDEQDDAAHQLHFHNKKKLCSWLCSLWMKKPYRLSWTPLRSVCRFITGSARTKRLTSSMSCSKRSSLNTVPLFCARTAPQNQLFG